MVNNFDLTQRKALVYAISEMPIRLHEGLDGVRLNLDVQPVAIIRLINQAVVKIAKLYQ